MVKILNPLEVAAVPEEAMLRFLTVPNSREEERIAGLPSHLTLIPAEFANEIFARETASPTTRKATPTSFIPRTLVTSVFQKALADLFKTVELSDTMLSALLPRSRPHLPTPGAATRTTTSSSYFSPPLAAAASAEIAGGTGETRDGGDDLSDRDSSDSDDEIIKRMITHRYAPPPPPSFICSPSADVRRAAAQGRASTTITRAANPLSAARVAGAAGAASPRLLTARGGTGKKLPSSSPPSLAPARPFSEVLRNLQRLAASGIKPEPGR
jgi:hypothetical protein